MHKENITIGAVKFLKQNFPESMADHKICIQDVQRTPSKMNSKKSTSKLIQHTENLTQRKNLEKSQRSKKEEEPYLQRNKDKNYIKLLIKNHVSKKSRIKSLRFYGEKVPTENCVSGKFIFQQ